MQPRACFPVPTVLPAPEALRRAPRRIPWLRAGAPRAAVAALLAACAAPPGAGTGPRTHELRTEGAVLPYVEQGAGVPVVFVHGAWMDLRYWEPQRPAVAARYRYVAYTQRYHGTGAWPDRGARYSAETHASDLAALVRRLNAGPVHLVGLSSGAVAAVLVAGEHPELVRSLTLVEPALGTLLGDDPEASAALADRAAAFGPIAAAVRAGDDTTAAGRFFDWVNNRGPGAFDRQPEALRRMVLENARTIPLFLSAPAPELTCGWLGRVTTPALLVEGAESRRFFRRIVEVAGRCIPGSRRVTIPGATHLLSRQEPAAFDAVLLRFLAGVPDPPGGGGS